MWLDVAFGNYRMNLTTVGYRFYKDDGTYSGSRITTGVVEVNNGAYGVDATIPIDAVGIEWDTGETIPLFANEDLIVNRVYQSIFNRRVWNKVGNFITLYDDNGSTVLAVFDVNSDLSSITPQS